jgi:hypothetical protein
MSNNSTPVYMYVSEKHRLGSANTTTEKGFNAGWETPFRAGSLEPTPFTFDE